MEIVGEIFKRTIFIPPAIPIPQQFCESCWLKTRQKEKETLPYVLVILVFILLIPLAFLLMN